MLKSYILYRTLIILSKTKKAIHETTNYIMFFSFPEKSHFGFTAIEPRGIAHAISIICDHGICTEPEKMILCLKNQTNSTQFRSGYTVSFPMRRKSKRLVILY